MRLILSLEASYTEDTTYSVVMADMTWHSTLATLYYIPLGGEQDKDIRGLP